MDEDDLEELWSLLGEAEKGLSKINSWRIIIIIIVLRDMML
jgi:hypothetical protein